MRYRYADGAATITTADGKANEMLELLQRSSNGFLDQAQATRAVVLVAGRTRRFFHGYDMATFS